MQLFENQLLTACNTLGLSVRTRYLITANSADDVREALAFAAANRSPVLVLGGGSNIVFASDFDGVVVRMVSKGVRIDGTRLTGAAGENWHRIVMGSLHGGLYGLENLALIPGTLGGAPVQNIGAYGVELARFIVAVEAIRRSDLALVEISREGCRFGYRDSLFKSACKDQFVITGVTLDLLDRPELHLDYPGVVDELRSTSPTPLDVADAICRIRRRKLPDPSEIGNVGSFFKNPLLTEAAFQDLRRVWPEVPGYADAEGRVKVSAAWLIDRCGLKGVSDGGARVSQRHALVIENHAGATPDNVLALAAQVTAIVRDRTGIALDTEPVIVGQH